ncbi:MAG TPA: response regulator transcription factor [Prolixibacteraceae bacterium]|nr:response regulator transcription factor [Prolixibacteraceae bacterium]HPS11916.1 response regulator transcription factor [Prolixibacteraceae bacterium]
MNRNRILVIEDEQRVANLLRMQLENSGFEVETASDGYVGKELVEKNQYQLILLDINLPLINGYELCKEIRKTNSNVPIIMLTALGSLDNKVTGFEAGADDYVTKPFDYRELVARINVFIKRSVPDSLSETLKIADLVMNLTTKTVTRKNKKIELTAKEFSLLETFLKNKGKLLTRDFIIEQVWGIDFDPNTNIIDVYVNYLRKKVDKEFEPKLIHTKFGFGFYCSEEEL